MSTTTDSRPRLYRGTHHLSADAWLYAAALSMILFAVQELVFQIAFGGSQLSLPDWVGVANTLSLLVPLVGGAVGAWWVHGRRLRGRVWLGMLVGGMVAVAAVALVILLLQGIRMLLAEVLPPMDGPWDLVALVVLGGAAFLAVPILAAVKDLIGARERRTRDWLRLAALLVLLIGVVATLVIGGETGEAGIFAVMFGTVAAFAVVGGTVADRLVRPSSGAKNLSAGGPTSGG